MFHFLHVVQAEVPAGFPIIRTVVQRHVPGAIPRAKIPEKDGYDTVAWIMNTICEPISLWSMELYSDRDS